MARLDVTRWAKKVFKDYTTPDVSPSESGVGARSRPLPESVRTAARRLREGKVEQANLERMQALDDAWNNQDWATFEKLHAVDTVVRWPSQLPTHGIAAHRAEAIQMFKTFPDARVENRPYRVLFASGDWTCSIARFHGTMRDLLTLPDGRMMPPTGRAFEVDLCTVARWENGQIIEENLFYDLGGMMKQLGIDA